MSAADRSPVPRRMKRRNEPLLKSCLLGAAGGLAALSVFLLLFSAALNGAENPGPLYLPLALFSFYVGALGTGILSVRLSGDGLVSGLLGGCVYTAAVFLFSLLPLPSAALPPSAAHILLLLALPASALGAVLGHRKPKKPSFIR